MNLRKMWERWFGKKEEEPTKSSTFAQANVEDSTTTKWCTDCKWQVLDLSGTHRCNRKPQTIIVLGATLLNPCLLERSAIFALDTCGPEGKYWEPLRPSGAQ